MHTSIQGTEIKNVIYACLYRRLYDAPLIKLRLWQTGHLCLMPTHSVCQPHFQSVICVGLR